MLKKLFTVVSIVICRIDHANNCRVLVDHDRHRMSDIVFPGSLLACGVYDSQFAKNLAFRIGQQRELNAFRFCEFLDDLNTVVAQTDWLETSFFD